jgi:hypothetical protein
LGPSENIKRSQPSAAPTTKRIRSVGAAEGCDLLILLSHPEETGALFCFQIYVAQNFHKASKTIRARRHRRTVINGNAAIDRATFAHRANPGAENRPTEGKAPLYF